jgi:hypothetical protein
MTLQKVSLSEAFVYFVIVLGKFGTAQLKEVKEFFMDLNIRAGANLKNILATFFKPA